MKLSTFIESHLEQILNEWDKFAETLVTGKDKKNSRLLRDHARELLMELTVDMETAQSAHEQTEKSKGRKSPYHPDDNAANVHGVSRQNDGFDVAQLVAEFRALRGSVLRLWLPKIPSMSKEAILEIVRFNEAIDEALADSIETFEG